MRSLILFAVLLVSNGLGAPLTEFRDLDKRRESTQEILNLEQQLKTAAGENKKIFSADEARPSPQIDGLDTEIEPAIPQQQDMPEVMDPAPSMLHGNDGSDVNPDESMQEEPDVIPDVPENMRNDAEDLDEMMNPNSQAMNDMNSDELAMNDVMDGVVPSGMESYAQMWKMFEEHPEYFEDFMQDKVAQ